MLNNIKINNIIVNIGSINYKNYLNVSIMITNFGNINYNFTITIL